MHPPRDLSGNRLRGPIPADLALGQLEELLLDGNALTGTLPDQCGAWGGVATGSC